VTPRRILALGWLVFLLYAYPGYMTVASHDIMLDGRYWEFRDLGSPLMSVVWRIVSIVVQGPFGMLLVQSGCVLFGAYALLGRAMPARTAAIASAALLVFPPVMAAVAVIDQDAFLASVLVAGTALLTSPHRKRRIAGLVAMALACGLRETGWLVVGPIVVFTFVWDAGHRRLVRYPIAVAAWLACALLARGANNTLVDHATRNHETSLAMFDIVGILANSPTTTDAQIRERAGSARFAVLFSIQETARELRNKGRRQISALFVEPVTDDDVEALLAARANLRASALGAYAKTRWKHWQRILYPRKQRSMAYTDDATTGTQRIASAHDASHSRVQRALIWIVNLVEATPLFAPFLYLALALVMLVLARRDRTSVVLLASGIVLELALAFTTWDVEYRYSAWLIVATALTGISVVHRWVSASRPAPQPV
jgi:hypothetical protein